MIHYIVRRLLQAIPMMFLISVVLFGLVNLAPGGPLAGHGQSRRMRPEKREQLKRQFGLDKPLPDLVQNGLSGAEREAEVAPQDAPALTPTVRNPIPIRVDAHPVIAHQPYDVLNRNRLVQAKLPLELLALLRPHPA